MSRKMMVKPWVKIMVDDLDLFIKMACSLFCDRDAESYTDEGDVERGRLWVFRGQADSQWKILSTLERHKVSGRAQSLELKQTEQLLYKEFIRESICYTSIENKSLFDVLALMRHYKVPTRLVDFSESPFVALYFGIEDTPHRDFCVWAVCIDDLREYPTSDDVMDIRPGKIKSTKCVGMENSRKQFDENFFSESDTKFKPDMFYAYPRQGNLRQSAQSGLFLLQSSLGESFMSDMIEALNCRQCKVYETSLSNLYKTDRSFDVIKLSRIVQFVFNGSQRGKCISLLRAMNISAKTIYPGLEGVGLSLSQYISRKEVK